ncbi:MAG: DNA recombination protein RmuC [Proteobacteria bacterium]|nr:DNA recombination protein RmuC [Pseudomonadota bacterium]
MEFIQIAVLLLIIAILGIQVYNSFFKKKESDSDDKGLLLLQQQLQELTRTMDLKMGESAQKMYDSMQTQSSQSQRLIQDINKQVHEQLRLVTKEVAEVTESNKKVFDVGEQLQNLETVLKHQKQRGNLGEASLQLALENILPATAYKLQYMFEGGETVDAVIITKDGMIPVDAKFSLDNYRRLVDATDDAQRKILEKEFKNDLKKRIDETAKYIKPQEGTLDFAFMFIPSEAVYYDLLINKIGAVKVNTVSLIEYAAGQKKVMVVSPTTFLAYLQTV